MILIGVFRHDEVSKYLCQKGAMMVLDEFEAGVMMCKVDIIIKFLFQVIQGADMKTLNLFNLA